MMAAERHIVSNYLTVGPGPQQRVVMNDCTSGPVDFTIPPWMLETVPTTAFLGDERLPEERLPLENH